MAEGDVGDDIVVDDQEVARARIRAGVGHSSGCRGHSRFVFPETMQEEAKSDCVDGPVQEVLLGEAPVEEAPVEKRPRREGPVEEAPVRGGPEEGPVEEAPVEEAPVEEAPSRRPLLRRLPCARLSRLSGPARGENLDHAPVHA